MMQMRNIIPPPITVVLILAILQLGGLATKKDGAPILRSKDLETQPKSATLVEQEKIDLPNFNKRGREKIDIAASRPLFEQYRKVVVKSEPEVIEENPVAEVEVVLAPQVPQEVQQPIAPQLSYLGYFKQNNNASALLSNEETGVETWVSEGDSVQDWIVVRIDNLAIELSQSGFTHVIKANR